MPPKRKAHADQLALAWRPQVGHRVTMGTEVVYSITRVSMDGRDVDLEMPGTNVQRFRVSVDVLKSIDPVHEPGRAISKPNKPEVNLEEIQERIATAQHSSINQFSGDIAILKKYLKSKGIEAAALKELDSLCEGLEESWKAAAEAISKMLEED